jgi:hypothetical protein
MTGDNCDACGKEGIGILWRNRSKDNSWLCDECQENQRKNIIEDGTDLTVQQKFEMLKEMGKIQ